MFGNEHLAPCPGIYIQLASAACPTACGQAIGPNMLESAWQTQQHRSSGVNLHMQPKADMHVVWCGCVRVQLCRSLLDPIPKTFYLKYSVEMSAASSGELIHSHYKMRE